MSYSKNIRIKFLDTSFLKDLYSIVTNFKIYVDKKTERYKKYIGKELSIKDLKQCTTEILRSFKQDASLNSLLENRRLWHKIPLCLPFSYNDKDKLIDVPEFLNRFLHIIGQRKDFITAKKLRNSVFRNYCTYEAHLDKIMVSIKNIILNSTHKISCKKLAESHNQYKILDVDIVDNIFRQIISPPPNGMSNKKTSDIFQLLCIRPSIQSSELMEEVGKRILQFNQKQMTQKQFEHLDRVFEYFAPEKDMLNFVGMHKELIESLLLPFIDIEPSPDIRKKINEFLLNHFGHPRMKNSAINDNTWTEVSNDAKDVFIRWQTELTMNHFEKMVDDMVRTDYDKARHWDIRKKFWKEKLKDRKIIDSYIILGNAYNLENEKGIKFGRFTKGTGDRKHCCILMKTDTNYVLVEWSHYGALRAYDAQKNDCPELHKSEYDPDDLRSIRQQEKGWFAHGSYGRWKDKIEDYVWPRRLSRKI